MNHGKWDRTDSGHSGSSTPILFCVFRSAGTATDWGETASERNKLMHLMLGAPGMTLSWQNDISITGQWNTWPLESKLINNVQRLLSGHECQMTGEGGDEQSVDSIILIDRQWQARHWYLAIFQTHYPTQLIILSPLSQKPPNARYQISVSW